MNETKLKFIYVDTWIRLQDSTHHVDLFVYMWSIMQIDNCALITYLQSGPEFVSIELGRTKVAKHF
jgi:hypothetical protein